MSEPYWPGTQIEVEVFVRTFSSRLTTRAEAGDLYVDIYDPSRWAAGDTLKFGDGDPINGSSEIATIAVGGIVGNVVQLTAALKYDHGAGTPVYRLANATMAASRQVEPAGTPVAVALNPVTTGRYRGTVTLADADAGQNSVEVNATGAVIASRSTVFNVRAPIV